MKVDLNYLLVIPCQCLGHLTQHPWECYCPCRLGQQPCQCCLSCLGKHHQYSPWSPGKQEVEILSHAWKMCEIYSICILSVCGVRVSPCNFAESCGEELVLAA